MATTDELLILARLKNEVSRPAREIKGDFDQLTQTLRGTEKVTAEQARELRKLGAEARRASRDAEQLARKWSDAGRSMTQFLTIPIAAAMGLSVKAASDLNEQLSRSEVVFGRNAAAVQAWAATAARSMGLSTRAALENAASFGNLFSQMGFAGGEATMMSQRLVELSADVASFNNVTGGAQAVLETFAAAFRGEYDSVQRFVPTIRAATVEQQAMAMGLADASGELSDHAKALATYQLLVEGTGAAAGDFTRTQESAANQMRTAQAAIEDAAASIGESLLPAVADGAGLVAELASAFAELPEPVQSGVVGVLGVLALSGPIVFAIGKVRLLSVELNRAALAGNRTALAIQRIGPAGRIAATGLAALTAAAIGLEVFAGRRRAGASGYVADVLGDNPLSTLDEVRAGLRSMEFELSNLERSEGRHRLFSVGGVNIFSTIGDADRQERIDQLRSQIAELERTERSLVSQERQTADALGATGAAAVDASSAWDDLNQAIADARDQYDMWVGRFADLEELRLRQRQAVEGFRSEIFGATGLGPGGEVEFALSQLEATRALVEAEQRAGELAAGPVAAYERQVELIEELIRLFPRLADEFEPYLQRLRDAGFYTGVAPTMRFNKLGSVVGSPRSNLLPVGDTTHPMSAALASTHAALGGSTLDAWRSIDAAVPGSRTITSHVRGWGLGSPDSDHLTGRAVDVVGSNLSGVIAAVRRAGGFAEMHGAGASRHAHVVPAPARGGGRGIVNVPLSVTVIGKLSADEVAGFGRRVRREIRAAVREAHERG